MRRLLRSHHPGSESLTCEISLSLRAEKYDDFTYFTLFSYGSSVAMCRAAA